MAVQGLTDIDTLAIAVRDQESKRLIAEAITAYRGGALRSAIMSTWIAVAFDIIAKARELAAQGESAPKAFVDDLDSAIANRDIKKMLTIESDLLKIASDNLQLLAPHESDALERLQRDRNLCAHPAFIVEDELYQPSPELVRSHIAHALQHLLIHAPLQGKSAITRFDADLMSPSFPTSGEDIGAFIRAKYLDRAKDALVSNLIKALISAPFGDERERYTDKLRFLTLTLREIAKAKTALYDSTVPAYVARKLETVSDDALLSICPYFESDARIWRWLSEPVKLRIKQLLKTEDVETLKANAAFESFAVGDLGEILLERFEGFDRSTQVSIISEHPRREFVQSGIELYSQAGNYRTAESWGRSVILSLAPFFAPEDIKSLVDAVHLNGQIWCASGTPTILETVYDKTVHLLPETQEYWQAFVDHRIADNDGDVDDYYSYPGLQQRLQEGGSTP